MKELILAAALVLVPIAAYGDQAPGHHGSTMDHAAHMAEMGAAPAAAPTEPGQSAFAAIQEIVSILEADPKTDWSRVDIEALRQHLIDMNNVTLGADVKADAVDDGARFTVTGQGAVVGSIRRMVSAHAATMSGQDGWSYATEEVPNGAVLVVSVADPADVAKVRALGFIGVMTIGAHHQQHHLMIAAGQAPHH